MHVGVVVGVQYKELWHKQSVLCKLTYSVHEHVHVLRASVSCLCSSHLLDVVSRGVERESIVRQLHVAGQSMNQLIAGRFGLMGLRPAAGYETEQLGILYAADEGPCTRAVNVLQSRLSSLIDLLCKCSLHRFLLHGVNKVALESLYQDGSRGKTGTW